MQKAQEKYMTRKMDSRHKTRAKAEARAKKLRGAGQNAQVRRDPFTGEWIVDIILLGVALTFLGAAFRQQ